LFMQKHLQTSLYLEWRCSGHLYSLLLGIPILEYTL
jgi:hypothetical protein